MKKYLLLVALVAPAYADHPHWTPPQAAFDACAKSKQGDTCSFQGKADKTVNGTCEVPHHGSATALVCRPPHHHMGSGSAH
jgi:hypothetical protein